MRAPLALFLTASALAGCPGADVTDDDSAADDDSAPASAYVFDSVPSALRQNPVSLGIYLPPGYEEGGPWPVIYLLHGDGGDEASYIDGSAGEDSDVKTVADAAIAAGLMGGAVIVTPDASVDVASLPGEWPTVTYFDPGGFYVDSDLDGPYQTVLMDEVLPYVEANYDVLPGPEHRGLMGHSMGGFGTLHLALEYGSDAWAAACAMSPMAEFYVLTLSGPQVVGENPDLEVPVPGQGKSFTNLYYSLAASFSPNLEAPPWYVDHPIVWSDPSLPIVDEIFDRWYAFDPMTRLEDPAARERLASIPLRMDVGDHDEYYFHIMAGDFSGRLDELGIAHEYELYEGLHSDRVYERLASNLPWVASHLE